MYTDIFCFFCIILPEKFSELTAGMEILEEYADEECPYTEWNNFQREPI